MIRLPIRSVPHHGQALTDWLEHLADDNGLPTASISSLLRDGGSGNSRFLAVRPTPLASQTITALTGVPGARIRAGTLARFHGTALNLDGLDPARWSSWRTVAARGWFRPRGTAACPSCLAEDGRWKVAWRLPTVTVCTRHRTYLLEECPGCTRRLADHPATPLRRGAGTKCLNPLGHRYWCDVDIAALTMLRAADDDVRRQTRHDAACDGSAIPVLGAPASPDVYLADVRHLAVLLLHLAPRPSADDLAAWVADARMEAQTVERRRWHLAPPADPRTRSAVMSTADAILSAPDIDTAADSLAPWIDTAPKGTDSRLGWLADRTTMTPTLTCVTMAALAPHQRISTHLRRTSSHCPPSRIPQVIPKDLYDAYARHLFTTRGETNRLFMSLCLARQAGAATWADAAGALGVDPNLGTSAARAVSARSRPGRQELAAALDQIRRRLNGDYRDKERRIGRMCQDRGWFDLWVYDHRPGTLPSSFRYAVAHLWCQRAGGLLATSPGWAAPPPRSVRALFRQFETSLSQAAATALDETFSATRTEKP